MAVFELVVVDLVACWLLLGLEDPLRDLADEPGEEPPPAPATPPVGVRGRPGL